MIYVNVHIQIAANIIQLRINYLCFCRVRSTKMARRNNLLIGFIIVSAIIAYGIYNYQSNMTNMDISEIASTLQQWQKKTSLGFIAHLDSIDKLCIHTIPDEFVNKIDDMPIQIPESLDLPEPVLACMYHRYLTTLQTLCMEPRLFGKPESNAGFICVDGDLVSRGDCRTAIFDGVVGKPYINQLTTQYKCKIMKISGSDISSFDRFLSDPISTQVTMFVIVLKTNDTGSKMNKILSYIHDTPNIKELTMKIHFEPMSSATMGYIERLHFFRDLYNKGFRIFYFDRDWNCLPLPRSGRQFMTCYSVYLMRPLAKPQHLVTIPTSQEINKFSKQEILRVYDRFLSSFHILCHQNLRLGKIRDGGWNVCHDPKYRPKPPCIIYSFGIKNDFSFDDAASEIYGCNVYSFDPSMNKENHQHSEKVWFYNVGIAGKDYMNDRKWDLRTLASIMEMLGHKNKKIDILKMDVESSEWPLLKQVLNTNILDNVGQLYFEFHDGNKLERIQLLRKLYDRGFRIFWSHRNPFPVLVSPIDGGFTSRGFEVYFINTNFYK